MGEFERPSKGKKNGVFLFVISHLVSYDVSYDVYFHVAMATHPVPACYYAGMVTPVFDLEQTLSTS